MKTFFHKLGVLQKIIVPPKYTYFFTEFRGKKVKFLDVGCANNSVERAKIWFPESLYYGLDYIEYSGSAREQMAGFYFVDLTSNDLTTLPNAEFNIILVSHVIEHVPNGLAVVEGLIKKLKKNGVIYIEYPSVRSLGFPKWMGRGVRFHNDPTHIRVYSRIDLVNILLSGGMKVDSAGTRRNLYKIVLFPLVFVFNIFRGIPSEALWDIVGFSEYIYARKV
jgi:SAM-dependent methyltransferase